MPRMTRPLTILGIESSCDETAAAVLRLADGRVTLLSDVIHTQLEEHAPYQGVVPEIAARAHAEIADKTVASAFRAGRRWSGWRKAVIQKPSISRVR